MEVILVEPVRGLGERGATVKVADGYARNFLLPKRLAIVSTGNAARAFQHHASQAERRESKLRTVSEQKAARLAGVRLRITAHAGEEGVLFGSVTPAMIADELAGLGHEIEKRQVELDEPIKRIGEYEVPIRFPGAVIATVPVEVVAG